METDAKKFCAKCGAELEDDALFCSECGTPLPKQEETPQNEAPMEEAAKSPRAEVTKEEPIKMDAMQDEKAAESSETAATVPENGAHKEEAHMAEQPSAETPVAEAPGEEPPTKSIAPAPQAFSAPTAQPAQKFCLRCGSPLPLDAMFCQKCGTPQAAQPQQASTPSMQPQQMNTPPAQPQNAAAQTNQPSASNNINIDVEAFKAGVNKGGLNHALLGVSVLAAISVFLPVVNVAGMANLKLMDISSFLSVIILVVAAGTAYASMLGKYEIPVVTGHGFLLLLLFCVYKYQSKLHEMEANFWTALARNAFRADWGFYLMVIAVLGLIFVGLMAGLQQAGTPTELNFLADRWKQIMLQPVQIHTFKFQGIAWAIVLALLMIFAAMQSGGAKQLGL
ncbi:MAG: zinc-ribbon domain-containing protein [Schwartzia sp.]|nr:zinc-ribbon domain-containing protein [Schwartzia sp. (in: firmicutes)]